MFYKNEKKEYNIDGDNMRAENKIVEKLTKKKWHISFAESCTGGMLVSTLINASGASNVINESFVTYSNESKIKNLSVLKDTIERYSVYSKEVADEMVMGLKNLTNCEVCVSVTGEAESNEDFCTCYYGIIINGEKIVETALFRGSRNEVRTMQTNHILTRILELLD